MANVGKLINEIVEGDKLTVTERIINRDIMIYLGLTNDTNPLYTQKDYVERADFETILAPPVLVIGIITSSISKLFPGPGSQIVNISTNFILPIYQNQNITFKFEIIRVDEMKEVITISVEAANKENERVLDALIMVKPPKIS
ncbi:MaoC/PaaZ C-terminal domain-containing protein [Dellaglioa sp. BT-FLS60]